MNKPTPPTNTDILAQTMNDLRGDFAEITYLLSAQSTALSQFRRSLITHGKHIPIVIHTPIKQATNALFDEIDYQKTELVLIKNKLSRPQTIESATQLGVAKNAHFHLLRARQGRIAAVITSTDWQSPSYAHSIMSQAGRQTGTIYATMNDYKRDQHWDAYTYERMFLKEYIDGLIKFPVNIHASSSGMAAFTTILNFLLMEQKNTGPVVIGKSIYFENKQLAKSAFGSQIIEVDEMDTAQIIDVVQKHDPSILMFDTIANMPDVAAPNLQEIFSYLVRTIKKETYVIIDNTSTSVFFQPLSMILGKNRFIRLVVFESLNKYHQFGLDRTTGGILWAVGRGTEKLFDYRDHLGTNIIDTSVVSMPSPNRKTLSKRLTRLGRNALLLASSLQAYINTHPASPVERIVYPGLSNHQSYTWTAGAPFHGSYFVLQFQKKYQTTRAYKKFIDIAITQAKKHHIDLIAGTSFGLNTTRIYLTAVRYKAGTPFVRIAAGSEDRIHVEILKRVFIQTLEKYR